MVISSPVTPRHPLLFLALAILDWASMFAAPSHPEYEILKRRPNLIHLTTPQTQGQLKSQLMGFISLSLSESLEKELSKSYCLSCPCSLFPLSCLSGTLMGCCFFQNSGRNCTFKVRDLAFPLPDAPVSDTFLTPLLRGKDKR